MEHAEERRAISFEVIDTKLNFIMQSVKDIKQDLEKNYVTRMEFDPVKKIIYGLVGIILLAVVGAMVTLVVNK